MFSVVFWIAFGATIGWTAAIMKDERGGRAIGRYLLIGAMGGLAGGFLGGFLDPSAVGYHTTTTDIMFAVFGATTFLVVARFFSQKRSDQEN